MFPWKDILWACDEFKRPGRLFIYPSDDLYRKRRLFCPKFLGLPDIIKSSLPSLPPLIEPTIDIRKSSNNFKNFFLAVGRLITNNFEKIYKSFYEAQKNLQSYYKSQENELDKKIISRQYNKKLPQGDLKNFLNIALLDHSYLIYDYFINLNLISKLKKVKINVLTAEMVKKIDIERQLK